MALTTTIQCYSHELFDLYAVLLKGQITCSTDEQLLLLDYNIDGLAVSNIVTSPTDPSIPYAAGTIYHNTISQDIFVSVTGEECVLVGNIVGRDGVNVISKDLIELPESPQEGDQYIVSILTQTLTTHKNQITQYVNGTWEYTLPKTNEIVGVIDVSMNYKWSGASWVKVELPWIKVLR